MRLVRFTATAALATFLVPAIALCQTTEQDTNTHSHQQRAAQVLELPDWMKGVPNARVENVPERIFSGNVALYRAGQPGADAVLLIHGIGQSGAADWKFLIPALAVEHDVYAIDLPGFGQSGKGNHLYSPDNYVKLIKTTLTPKIGRPFSLIGHSMGAAVSLEFTSRYPTDVSRLILVDMAGVLHRTVYAESLGRAWVRKRTGGNNGASAWLESFMTSMLRQLDSMSLDNSLVLNFASMRNRFFNGDPNRIAGFALVEHDFSAALRKISRPTLIVWGEDDVVAPLRTGQLAASTIRGARLSIIKGASHTPQLEKPDELIALVVPELRGALRIPEYALPDTPVDSSEVAYCHDESNKQYTGEYQRITLDQCANAQISGARIGTLDVTNSTVHVVNSHIANGVTASRSRLTITGGSVGGKVPFVLKDANIDAAGTRFSPSGEIAVNNGDTPVTLQLSVVESTNGDRRRFLHQLQSLQPRLTNE